jgi:steroid delta-isomerase-like uncharacterized protein
LTDIEKIVREFYSAMNEGDLDSVMKYIADDAKIISTGNRVIDKHRFRDMLSQTKNAFPDRKVTIKRIMTKDNAAMVEFMWNGTHTGEYLGHPATNNRIEFPVVDILEFESGKVKLLKDVFNWRLFERGINPQR